RRVHSRGGRHARAAKRHRGTRHRQGGGRRCALRDHERGCAVHRADGVELMTTALIALDEPRASTLRTGLEREGVHVVAVVAPGELTVGRLREVNADAVILSAGGPALTADLVSACDRAGVRIVTLGPGESRLLGRYGLPQALVADADPWQVA